MHGAYELDILHTNNRRYSADLIMCLQYMMNNGRFASQVTLGNGNSEHKFILLSRSYHLITCVEVKQPIFMHQTGTEFHRFPLRLFSQAHAVYTAIKC